ncbi:Sensor histidine kinase RcsC [Xanthomonas sacchari]|uniref:hybrid sensor histidine kinase/response regulator n=1 Tax=Xanthomonas sacchari TaxID=56458 RepID=UPI002253416E|nr:ATP-binding protein [Xanthomonas sacchari]MCW0386883.1 Sensor histidine kinase RcsC [Xanthomonas sacchari]
MYRELAQAQRDAQLDAEQRKALLMIASGAPMAECLDALTDAVGRLVPDARACVLLASRDRRTMGDGYSSHFPPAFAAAIRGLPIGEALIGTCGTAIHEGHPVECEDVEHASQWAAPWRSLCLENGILACYSHPAIGQGGKAVGSFFLCLSEARQANAWERKVAEFGALATSIVVERERAAAYLRKEMAALARLQELSAELVGPGEFEPLLQKILAAAADISGTDKGNIQIFDPVKKTLRIVVHQGLGARLVEHFREDGWDASCGKAAKQVQRLVVADVEKLEGLQGTLGLEIVMEDQIRSIQCTPLLSRDGRLLGMLNNHYRWPGGPDPDALRYIDLLARQAAELVERHQIEAELAQERRRKDEFLAMLAHELRNPLAPLRNMLEVLKRSHGNEALSRKAQEVMERQVRHLMRLVDDLLDVNRIKQGKLELRREPLLLAEVIQQAVEVCRPALDQQRHRLRVVLPEAPLPLQGDPIRLTQVFGNLLTNACKYTPPGGDIEVRVDAIEGSAEVVVQDNGSGIPPDKIDAIFELFTQVDRTLERAQGGLGIGLMLVRQLVEMHGGTVEARSEGAGKGSTFVVRLPSDAAPAAVSGTGDVRPAPTVRRILVVDDNADIALALAALLELDGHDVRTAGGGEEALALGARVRPEVILMDIGMPGMDGHEACRRIRDCDWGRDITIVALTGWGQDGDRQDSARAGFDAHLVKPVGFAELHGLFAGLD